MTTKKENLFPVSEIFGPTIQGEGPVAGAKCYFVRFALCDFHCTWCDSKHTWDKNHPKYGFEMMSAAQIVARLDELKTPKEEAARIITLSGGNPGIQKEVGEIMDLLPNVTFTLETQGSVFQPWMNGMDWVVVSPKLLNAKLGHLTQDSTGVARFLNSFTRVEGGTKFAMKIVCYSYEDVDEAYTRFGRAALLFNEFYIQVGTLPTDTAQEIISRWRRLAEYAVKMLDIPVRVLPQSHVLLWGHKLGV